MNWKKLGKIIEIDKENDWAISHSAVPFADYLHNDVYRIYFSVRNKDNQSQTAYVDYDIVKLEQIGEICKTPVLKNGDLGLFDDCGVTASCLNKESGYLYYMGWSLPKTVPFSNQIGAAKILDDNFEKVSNLPILGKTEKEPYSFGYPWVLKVNDKFYMWYDTNLFWKDNSTDNYEFVLRSATSEDGLVWKKTYQNCFELKDGEKAIARPCVIYENEVFKMWYSVNFEGKYRLGYAESHDGMNWDRKDDLLNIEVSQSGWDSEQVEYPFVFSHLGKKHMLYNGNGYGKTGIGLAKLS